ncbi:hypothetical protein PACTADRAFT_50254 [Pachysolen tannophilus NRRL Y-2460]|uniref:Tyrosine specific protein phosphatases domain-containing protein n=1 Tax=Pachysolen tannophilus NRRL Y-2460 TaxID=669874 RepID=A0A1E4TUY8_PACTA|nr:hypothetical protein PACTADRAFT_50254 [Pachysolen tannophilus NRRL Y-2460]
MSSKGPRVKPLNFNEQKIFVKFPNSSNQENEKGLSAIFTSPHALFDEDFYSKGYSPSTHKLVILLHGNGGHKNYCYNSILAQELASKLGIFSIRFDFRGCGDSQDCKNLEIGRTIDQDIEDLELIIDKAINGGFNNMYFSISGIVAHSRGTLTMFKWALKQQEILEKNEKNYIFVPNLINCSGRFDYSLHLPSVKRKHLDWEDKKGYYIYGYKNGEYKEYLVPKNETLHLTSHKDLNKIKFLHNDVLSIYGLNENVIPLEDTTKFANLLGNKHQLEFIPNADHNFFGDINNLEDPMPLNAIGKVNYNYKVSEIIVNFFSHESELSRFYNRTINISSVSRWKKIEGVANFRDIGGWRVKTNKFIKPHIGYRSALLSKITPKGIDAFKELNINTIFDLRSIEECEKDDYLNIEGVKRYFVPVVNSLASPEDLMMIYKNLVISWATYEEIYQDILTQGANAFKQIFLFIRDHPGEPFLYHCTAGKDRTGIMTMLIYLLCGLDKITISKEYELTTEGLKPNIENMRKHFLQTLKNIDKEKEFYQAYEKSIVKGRKNWSIEEEGFQNVVSSRCEAMLNTIEMFNKKFGGITNYMLKHMDFKEEDLNIIRNNLICDDL